MVDVHQILDPSFVGNHLQKEVSVILVNKGKQGGVAVLLKAVNLDATCISDDLDLPAEFSANNGIDGVHGRMTGLVAHLVQPLVILPVSSILVQDVAPHKSIVVLVLFYCDDALVIVGQSRKYQTLHVFVVVHGHQLVR